MDLEAAVVSGRIVARVLAQRGAVVGLVTLAALAALSLLAPLVAPQDPSNPLGFDPLAANHPPDLSWTYLLGADGRGRSVLALLLWGGRVSLLVGAGSALLSVAIGVPLGALACWRDGLLDPVLSRLMDACLAAPPLLVLLVLSGRLGGLSAPLMVALFALTGWVAPARLTRAAVSTTWRAPHVEAARAAGVTGARLFAVHVLPDALAPVAAWVGAGAAAYVALEAGLDFLGLGLPASTTSWGTMLAGARDALGAGNWWWMVCGGAALAASTLALGAVARGVAYARDPTTVLAERRAIAPVETIAASDETEAMAPALARLWEARRGDARSSASPQGWGRPWARGGLVLAAALLLGGAAIGTRAGGRAAPRVPSGPALLRQANAYPLRTGQRWAYIATALYTANEAALGVHAAALPWAAWGACPAGIRGRRCAQSSAQLFFSGERGRVAAEGVTYVCTRQRTWGVNPMAGLAQTTWRGCGARGPASGGLGTTAGAVGALLPPLDDHPDAVHLRGSDIVAGRPCWMLALRADGQACVDATMGTVLRVERDDSAGRPVAVFQVTNIYYGLDLAPELFANPIPGGRGPLISGLTQPLLNIQAADDQASFFVLVPTTLPPGLTARTPTFDSFNDETRGYALEQRVRQTYADRAGRTALVLVETLAGSAWDITPPQSQARHVVVEGQSLLVSPHGPGRPALVRGDIGGAATLISSRTLPLRLLERVTVGLR